MTLLLCFGVLLLIAVLISGVAHRTVLSTAVLFLGAGVLLGQGFIGVVSLSEGDPIIGTLAEIALFVVLFTDGQRIGVRDLVSAWSLPGRALLLGMPLTFVFSAIFGVVVAGLSWPESLLVAAVLAPTDPVFASAIVGREEIPGRLRHLLSVESGVNDGIALPVVLLLLAAIGGPEVEPLDLIVELGTGVVIGIVVPAAVIALTRIRFFSATPLYAALTPIAIAIIVYGLSATLDANLYLAAFSAGVTIASLAPQLRDSFSEFGESVAEIVKLLAIFVFGALVAPDVLADVPLGGYLFAVLLLVVARPVAVEMALLGSKLSWQERLTAGWFGPKGFASVLYGLIVLDSGAENASQMFHLIVVAIALSILVHSSTDVPIAAYFGRDQTAKSPARPAQTAGGPVD